MNNLTTKQKIIIGVGISIIVVIIGIYGYSMLQQGENWEEDLILGEENLMNKIEDKEQQNTVENQNNEDTQNTTITEQIVIHITGAVQKTGILVLPEGARIADAIDAAGGSLDTADLDEVNLAYVLQDGQKIYIPKQEDKIKLENKAYITSESGNNVIVQTINTDKDLKNGGNRKVNINTATQNELENLPGIGSSIASRIIEYREQNGRFNKIEDLQNVKGIGDAKFGNIKDQIIVK